MGLYLESSSEEECLVLRDFCDFLENFFNCYEITFPDVSEVIFSSPF